jgi:hypothetical protein
MQEKIKELIYAKHFKEAFQAMKEDQYEHIDVIEADLRNELKVKAYGFYTEEEWEAYEKMIQDRLIHIVDYNVFISQDGEPVSSRKKGPIVFISYSGIDREVAEKIYNYLNAEGLEARIDTAHKSLMEDVYPFIREQFRLSDYVILLISPDSLASGWVGVEHELALFSDQLNLSKYLVVTNDKGRFNSDNQYFLEVLAIIDQKISELKELVEKVEKMGYLKNPYRPQLERFDKRKTSFGEVFDLLKARGTAADISGDRFEENIRRICDQIRAHAAQNKKAGIK